MTSNLRDNPTSVVGSTIKYQAVGSKDRLRMPIYLGARLD